MPYGQGHTSDALVYLSYVFTTVSLDMPNGQGQT